MCIIIDGGTIVPSAGLLVKGSLTVSYGQPVQPICKIDNVKTIVNGASSDGCSLIGAGYDLEYIAPAGTACGYNCSGPPSYDCSFDSTPGNPDFPSLTNCIDDCTAASTVSGCTDSTAFNYDPLATYDDGSCCSNTPMVVGCMGGGVQDSSCGGIIFSDISSGMGVIGTTQGVNGILNGPGCSSSVAGLSITNGVLSSYYDANANIHDPSMCNQESWSVGCNDPSADNYYPGTCFHIQALCWYSGGNYVLGCMDPTATNYDPLATADDGSCIFPSGPIFTTGCQASWLSCDLSAHPNFPTWVNTWTSNNAFQNPNNNPNQPCNHICQKIIQWTSICDSVDNSIYGSIPNNANTYNIPNSSTGLVSYSLTVNRLRCKLDEGQNQSQIHGCNC